MSPFFARNQSSLPHDSLYWRGNDGARWSTVSSDGRVQMKKNPGKPGKLFFLTDDVSEATNRSESAAEKVAMLREQWEKWDKSNLPNRVMFYKLYHDHRDQFCLEGFPIDAAEAGYSSSPGPALK